MNNKIKEQDTIRKLSVILECAGEGILGIDLDGNHTFVNPNKSVR